MTTTGSVVASATLSGQVLVSILGSRILSQIRYRTGTVSDCPCIQAVVQRMVLQAGQRWHHSAAGHKGTIWPLLPKRHKYRRSSKP